MYQLSLLCRKEATRTPDPYVPNVVRYQLRYFPMKAEGLSSACCFIVGADRLELLVLTQALNVYGTLHLEALYFRRLVELLTTTEFLYYASLLKFSLEFLKGSFDVLALFYGYYNHVV